MTLCAIAWSRLTCACGRDLGAVLIRRFGRGRARTRPDRVLADKAYSNKVIRAHLRRRGIAATIPKPADQIAHRTRRGRRGAARPVGASPGQGGDGARQLNTRREMIQLALLRERFRPFGVGTVTMWSRTG